MTAYAEWEVATSIIRSHLVENSLTELDPDGLLTAEEAEKLADRLDTLTVKVASEFLGDTCDIYMDGTVLIDADALLPDDTEGVLGELNARLAEVDYSSCYEDLQPSLTPRKLNHEKPHCIHPSQAESSCELERGALHC